MASIFCHQDNANTNFSKIKIDFISLSMLEITRKSNLQISFYLMHANQIKVHKVNNQSAQPLLFEAKTNSYKLIFLP